MAALAAQAQFTCAINPVGATVTIAGNTGHGGAAALPASTTACALPAPALCIRPVVLPFLLDERHFLG